MSKANEDKIVRMSKRKALERAKSKSDPFKGEEGKTLSRKEEDTKGKTKNM